MALFGDHLHIHVHVNTSDGAQIENLKTTIMGKIDELTSEIQNLKTSVAEEKAEVKAKLDEQTAKIDQLQQTVNDGGTPEQLNTLIADVRSLNEEVKGIYIAPADENGNPDNTPAPGTGEGDEA